MNVSSVVGQSREVAWDSMPSTPSIVSSIRACSSVLKSGWFSNGSSCMYLPSGISCSSAELRRFNSRWSWMTCANIDGLSTAIIPPAPTVFLSPGGRLDDLGCLRPRRDDDPVLAGAFCLVERGIGGSEEVLDASLPGRGCDAEAGRDRDRITVRREDRDGLDRRPRPLGQAGAALGVGSRQHEHELLATPAARDVALSHGGAEGEGELLQHLVAEGMPVGVVHALEVVEIGNHDAYLVVDPRGASELRSEGLLEPPPIRQPGEAVEERLALDDAVQPRVFERHDRLGREGR